jgi:hypothetical protein
MEKGQTDPYLMSDDPSVVACIKFKMAVAITIFRIHQHMKMRRVVGN